MGHFAAATVEQLLESAALAGMALRTDQAKVSTGTCLAIDCCTLTDTHPARSEQAIRGAARGRPLQCLYVPVNRTRNAEANPAVGSELIPLPLEAMHELISVYATREFQPKNSENPSSGAILPSAAAIFPATNPFAPIVSSSQENYFCLIQNPTSQSRSDAAEIDGGASGSCAPTALLVEFSTGRKGGKGAEYLDSPRKPDQTRASTKPKWDPTILWTFCRWRSCLSHSTALPAPKYLCNHHSNLKALLDSRAGKASSSESTRFLPKKPPTAPRANPNGSADGDLALIKAASSLLQELTNGKLSSTIQSFCQRAAKESSDRFWLKQAKGTSTPVPSWSRWADPEQLDAVFRALAQDARTATSVLEAERGTTEELKKLESFGVYPTAELTLIRKESSRSLESEVDEVDFCRHKMSLLKARREAVEVQLRIGDQTGLVVASTHVGAAASYPEFRVR